MGIVGQGRDPLPHVVHRACALTASEDWLYLVRDKWQIGNNIEFPSSLLFVRDVNRKMVNFIVAHFDEIPQNMVTKLCKSLY